MKILIRKLLVDAGDKKFWSFPIKNSDGKTFTVQMIATFSNVEHSGKVEPGIEDRMVQLRKHKKNAKL